MPWEPLPERRDTTRSLDVALGRLRTTMGLARPDTVRLLDANWEALLGRALASVCELSSVRGTTLVISTTDPAVAEQLRWSAPDVCGAANSIVGAGVLQDLEVRVRRR